MRRVLYLLDMLPSEGGGTKQTETCLKHLNRGKFEPHVWCTMQTAFVGRLKELSAAYCVTPLENVEYLTSRNPLRNLSQYLKFRKSLKQVEKYIKSHQIDLIHGDYHKGPYVVALSKKLGIPSLMHIRCELYPEMLRLSTFDGVNQVVSISDRLRRLLISGGVARDRIYRISDSVDCDQFKPSQRKGVLGTQEKRNETIFFGIVSRVVPHKRILEFLDILPDIRRTIPNSQFFIIGALSDTDYKTKLDKRLQELEVESYVHFTGEREDMNSVYADLDIVVSLAGGSVILEAMACAKPIVAASKANAAGENIILEGETGYLVPYNELPAMVSPLGLLSADLALRQQLGNNARKRAEAVFDARAATAKLEQLYDKLIFK